MCISKVVSDANAILSDLAARLGQTAAFEVVAGTAWVIPAVQTLHILAVAAVAGSAVMIGMRVLGAVDRERPLDETFGSYLPPLGLAIGVLALSGLVLIVGEPTRAVFRVIFWVKLGLVATGAALTWGLASVAQRRGGAVALDLKVAAVATLVLWSLVIVAGRWIGYANAWPGAPS